MTHLLPIRFVLTTSRNNLTSRFLSCALVLIALLACAGISRAGVQFVPNASFESQPTAFADPRVDAWQKPPQPNTFPTNFGSWDNLAGVFANSPIGDPTRINNADGNQLAFLFAYPQAGLFQDLNSTDWMSNSPTHNFNATFKPGKIYTLILGLTTSTFEPLTQGSTLQISLYYRDASNNMVTVASTTATYDTNVFTNLNQLIDFQVNVPAVQTNDAWAGQNIGIQFQSTVFNPALIGGVWDMDNVRLIEGVPVPNFSFESQMVPFGPLADSWQENPQPANFPTNFGSWNNLAGLFQNLPPTQSGYIDNAEESQLGYIFAYPQAGIFQDYNSIDWSNGPPTHAFNATFNPGSSYNLTVGLTSSSVEPLTPGSTLLLTLYYRDASSNMITVAATTATYDPAVFTNIDHLVNFQVNVPTVKSTDAWAGKNIGIQFESTVFNPALIGGVWDLDNVRLTETVTVPNYSFESQATPFALPYIDFWQKTPIPFFFTNGAAAWSNLTGVFSNSVPGDPTHIDNADGNQLGYIFAAPLAGFFQDLNSTDWSNGYPTHAFNMTFKPGKAYSLTVGLTSSTFEPLTPGSPLQLSFYYRDASNNMVTVASSVAIFDTNVFTNLDHLVDFQVTVPPVKPSDAWAGKNIGIQIESVAFDPSVVGGVWDLDNVRLVESTPTIISSPTLANGSFNFTLSSEMNDVFEIQASTNIAKPSGWSTIATITNVFGSYSFTDTNAISDKRFYRAHRL